MALKGYTTKRTAHPRCNRRAFAKRLSEVRKLKPKAEFRPLYRHLISLARQSYSVGACQRAGRELRYAKKVARY